MSEFRQDALRKHWVVIAEERAARPCVYAEDSRAASDQSLVCPFCRGNESETPTALAVDPPPPEPWQVRVTPNMYPAVSGADPTGRNFASLNPTDRAPEDETALRNGQALFAAKQGLGRHEVIIESPDHMTRASQLDDRLLSAVWRVYRERLAAVGSESNNPYARLFQNCGPRAGASIEHLHSQLIALPMIPNDSSRELEQQQTWFAESGSCGQLDLINAERDQADRVILETDGLIAYCPYASRFPYEVWIAPTKRAPSFVESAPELVDAAGRIVRRLVRLFDQALQCPDYNYLIQTAPFDRSADDYYHWRIELFPRLTTAAGFEISSGCYINPVRPEDAAQLLRNTKLLPDQT